MDIVQERLQREYDLNLILTTPNVQFLIHKRDGTTIDLESPTELPDSSHIKSVEEPYLTVTILTPVNHMDGVMELAKRKRGIFVSSEYVSDRMKIIFDIPLSEVIVDFNDMIKSITRGYGSIDYKFKGYHEAQIAKLDILLNDKVCDAFSSCSHPHGVCYVPRPRREHYGPRHAHFDPHGPQSGGYVSTGLCDKHREPWLLVGYSRLQ